MNGTKTREALVASARSLGLGIYSLATSIILFVLSVLSFSFILIGIGFFTTPVVIGAVRSYAGQRRQLAAAWSDVTILTPYRPFPQNVRSGITGRVERTTLILKDRATWRDLLWLLVDMTAGFTILVVSASLFVYGVMGFVLVAGLWRVFRHDPYWFAFIPVSGLLTAALAAVLGVGFLFAGRRYAAPLLKGHFLLTRSLIAPNHKQQQALRIARLTESRHDAVDSSAAELRRIERDLHDGAQARLVAVGMDLGTIEALIEKNPAKAKELIGKTRQSSAEALTELRDLVRGIHPPVLAERGLGDAVKALLLRLPVPTEVTVDLPGRADAPVESAAYFAVSEALTNVIKHADATRVWVDISYSEGLLRITVTDDGKGGARTGGGTGLSGLERRLGTFDGILAVSSPTGGPTMVTMEIPCELS